MKLVDLKHLFYIAKYPLLFLGICWLVFFLDNQFNLDAYQYGVSPRTAQGLKGILFSPFIHGDLSHILNNSLPILVLGSLIFYFYESIAWSSVLWIYVVSGIWLWIGGRNNADGTNYHIGASTLIYGFSTFLFFSGVFRKHKQLMVVSALVVLLYGSITWGIFPFDEKISWEGHLFGAIAGLLVAYSYRKEGPQPAPFTWSEIDNVGLAYLGIEDDDDEQMQSENTVQNPLDSINIVYHFKPTIIEDIQQNTKADKTDE